MAEFKRSREEVQALFDRFIEDNRRCEAERDWSRLADYYADDAVYMYTMGAAGLRVARGRQEIRRLVMQRDMMGFEGWTFPYEWVVIDGDRVITKWWNQAPVSHDDGTPYRILGNSNIRINDDLEIVEMHDNFDLAALLEMVKEVNRRKGAGIRIPGAAEAEQL
jgi:ketosteroid isomerase-like protein